MTAAVQTGVAGFLARFEALRDRLPGDPRRVSPLPMPSAARGFLVHRRVDARRHGNTPACVPWPTHHSCSL